MICSLQGPVVGMGIMEQPTCSKLSRWLTGEAEAGGRGAGGFDPVWRAERVRWLGWSLTSWSCLCSSRL